MPRLRITVPHHLSVASLISDDKTTEANAGIIYWIQENCPTAIYIPGGETCFIQFNEVWDLVQFKKQFGIDAGSKKNGGMLLTHTYVTAASEADHHFTNNIRRMMLTANDLVWYELRYMDGWFKLYVPIASGINSSYRIPLRQISGIGFVNRAKKRYKLEELVEIAHELRQLYVPAPIKLRTANYDYIDVTDREPIEIALLR